MDIYAKVKQEIDDKNRFKVGDVCTYFGDIYNLVYCNCVISNVLKNGFGEYSYVVKFACGDEEIVDEKDLVKMPGVKWQQANNVSYLGNTVSSLPFMPYDYKKIQNLLYGVNGTNIDRPVVEKCTFKTIKIKEEEKDMKFKIGDIVELIDGPSKGLKGKIVGWRGSVCTTLDDMEAVVDIDGNEYHLKTKRLKLISRKNEKGEKKMMFNFKVVGAYPNKKKGILAVKFNDGEVIKLACHNDDNFDINVGVALAMAYKSCGSKNAFRRNVEKVTQEVKSKEDKEDKVFAVQSPTKRGRKRKVTNLDLENTFGYKMRLARKTKRITQNELATLIGAGTSTIHNYERNDCLPNPKRRAKIMEILGFKY